MENIIYNIIIVWTDTVHNYQHHDRVKTENFNENLQKSYFFMYILGKKYYFWQQRHNFWGDPRRSDKPLGRNIVKYSVYHYKLKNSATGCDTAFKKLPCTQTIIRIALFLNLNVGILPWSYFKCDSIDLFNIQMPLFCCFGFL